MSKYISMMISTIKSFFKWLFKHTETGVEGDEEPNPTPSTPNPPIRLNRATRREMAKVLNKHPEHKGITHANLPLECSELEYLYWQVKIQEVEMNKFTEV